MTDRAVSPVVGVVILVVLTVILASAIASGVLQTPGAPAAPTVASFDAEADATGEIRVVHAGGNAVDPDDLELVVHVDGVPLTSQPPVPFFSARGFESGPTGVFNSATRDTWQAGEAASLRVAGSNEPTISEGATVTLRIYVDDVRVGALEVTAQAASTASSSRSPSASSASRASRSPSTSSASRASRSAAGPPSVSGT